MRMGFELWLEYTEERKLEALEKAKQQLAAALGDATTAAEQRVEGAVRAEAVRRIEQAQRIVRRMLHAQLASAFDSFHSRVIETRDKKKACQRVILRMQHVALVGAWEMFTGTVAQMRAHQQVVARAMSRWRTPSVRMGFELWLEYMEERKLGALGAEKLQVMHNLDCVDVYVCG